MSSTFLTSSSEPFNPPQSHPGHSAAAHLAATSNTPPKRHSSLLCNWCESTSHTESNCWAKQASQQQARENVKMGQQRGRRRHQQVTTSSTTPSTPSPSPAKPTASQDQALSTGDKAHARPSSLSDPTGRLSH